MYIHMINLVNTRRQTTQLRIVKLSEDVSQGLSGNFQCQGNSREIQRKLKTNEITNVGHWESIDPIVFENERSLSQYSDT